MACGHRRGLGSRSAHDRIRGRLKRGSAYRIGAAKRWKSAASSARRRDGGAAPGPGSRPGSWRGRRHCGRGACRRDPEARPARMRPRSRRRPARPGRAGSPRAVGARRPDRARSRPCSTAVGRPTTPAAVPTVRPRPMKRARSVSYCGSATIVALDDGEMGGPTLAARRASAGGAWRRAHRTRRDARSPRTSWRTPDARRRRPASSAPARRRTSVRSRAAGGRCWSSETRRTSPSSSPETRTSMVVVSVPSRRMNWAWSSPKTTSSSSASLPTGCAPADQTRPPLHVAQEDEGAPVVARRVLPPAGHGDVAPAAVARRRRPSASRRTGRSTGDA